jgi:hypothetical protein
MPTRFPSGALRCKVLPEFGEMPSENIQKLLTPEHGHARLVIESEDGGRYRSLLRTGVGSFASLSTKVSNTSALGYVITAPQNTDSGTSPLSRLACHAAVSWT